MPGLNSSQHEIEYLSGGEGRRCLWRVEVDMRTLRQIHHKVCIIKKLREEIRFYGKQPKTRRE